MLLTSRFSTVSPEKKTNWNMKIFNFVIQLYHLPICFQCTLFLPPENIGKYYGFLKNRAWYLRALRAKYFDVPYVQKFWRVLLTLCVIHAKNFGVLYLPYVPPVSKILTCQTCSKRDFSLYSIYNVAYGLKSLIYFSGKVWGIVPFEIRNTISLEEFSNKIRKLETWKMSL